MAHVVYINKKGNIGKQNIKGMIIKYFNKHEKPLYASQFQEKAQLAWEEHWRNVGGYPLERYA